MKTAQEVFAASKVNFGKPGEKVNSKGFSHFHSNDNFQVGGNRQTYAWHPQVVVPSDRKKLVSLTARPTQTKVSINGPQKQGTLKTPFNNFHTRSLAGSIHGGVTAKMYSGANTLEVQRSSRATSRGLSGVNTTSRRGGSSNAHFAKSVAGLPHTYAMPSTSTTGRQLVNVAKVHHIGLHKIVVTKPVDKSVNRPQGTL